MAQVDVETKIDPGICPLCGRPNHCRLAAEATAHEQCWCFSVTFPQTLLDRVPPQARQRACICQSCWTEATRPPELAQG